MQKLDKAIEESIQKFIKAKNGSEVRLSIYEYEELMFLKSKSMEQSYMLKADCSYRADRQLSMSALIFSITALIVNILLALQ